MNRPSAPDQATKSAYPSVVIKVLGVNVQERATDRRVSDDVVLDMGESQMIVGIEIMHASRNLDLSQLLQVRFERVG